MRQYKQNNLKIATIFNIQLKDWKKVHTQSSNNKPLYTKSKWLLILRNASKMYTKNGLNKDR